MDLCGERRDEVIAYATEKYGRRERVAQIIDFGRMKPRGVIWDLGRVLGWEYEEADALAKLVPTRLMHKDGYAVEVTLPWPWKPNPGWPRRRPRPGPKPPNS